MDDAFFGGFVQSGESRSQHFFRFRVISGGVEFFGLFYGDSDLGKDFQVFGATRGVLPVGFDG